MAASRGQRIAIWIIAITMAVGTIGSFVVIILANNNQQSDLARKDELMAEYQKLSTEYQAKVAVQATELSAKYFEQVNSYNSFPASFDAATITELNTEDIVVGDGEEVKSDSIFVAYYIGWTPDGKVFDGSIDGDKLKAPITVDLSLPGGIIQGWREGSQGMKANGVRLLSIPSAKAYAETGSGETIPPNTPLRFIMMIIPTPEKIPEPQPSEELLKFYPQQ